MENVRTNLCRFLDNCYIALDVTNINPLKIFDILNSSHDNIKFTKEQHNLHLPCLDISINKDPETNNIWTDIFYIYLYKNYVYFTIAKQIYTIVENSKVMKERLDELQKDSYSQEYPQSLIQEGQEEIRKATSISTENLRASKARTDSNNLAFVRTFIPNYKNFFPLIQTIKLLQLSYKAKECFKDVIGNHLVLKNF